MTGFFVIKSISVHTERSTGSLQHLIQTDIVLLLIILKDVRDEFLAGFDFIPSRNYESYRGHSDSRRADENHRKQHPIRYGWVDAILKFPFNIGLNARKRVLIREARTRKRNTSIGPVVSYALGGVAAATIGAPLTLIKAGACGLSHALDIYFPAKEQITTVAA